MTIALQLLMQCLVRSVTIISALFGVFFRFKCDQRDEFSTDNTNKIFSRIQVALSFSKSVKLIILKFQNIELEVALHDFNLK